MEFVQLFLTGEFENKKKQTLLLFLSRKITEIIFCSIINYLPNSCP